jgi:hypothetical protein
MTTTSLPDEMIKYFVQLNNAEQKSILQMVQTFLKSKNTTPQSTEEYNAEIKSAIEGAKRGETITVEEFEKEMQQW